MLLDEISLKSLRAKMPTRKFVIRSDFCHIIN